jgi:hypothetical protein
MANLTIVAADVRPVHVLSQQISGAGVAITAGQVGKFMSTGLVDLALATTAANARAIGVAVNGTAETGMLPTFVRKGIIDLGPNVLNAVAYGADIFLSDTAGTLSDTAGTVNKVIGTVVPGFGNTTPDKLLRVDL